MIAAVAALMAVGALLAVAEASVSRMSRVRAAALHEQGRRNAALLEEIASDPPRYLNSIYLAVMCVQNGSAILVAIVAQRWAGQLGVTLASVVFTLVYFVVVEAMSKTYGILHSDTAALALAPVVWFLGRILAFPTRLLIGLANVLLPGKGLEKGPFVSHEEIRSMADASHEEGAIAEQQKDMIHSILDLRDVVVREIMVPRPDIVAVHLEDSLDSALGILLERGLSRVPVHSGDLDHVEGVLHAKDALRALHEARGDVPLRTLLRPARFVPETKEVAALLREMQRDRFHIALVVDEYGSVSGLVTLEDVLEELVGEIVDEDDREAPPFERVNERVYRVHGGMPIHQLSELLDTPLPQDGWDTVAGLMQGMLGAIPTQGQEVPVGDVVLTAERVEGRRIRQVRVERRQAD
jgi:CBS domain containing-hemolysin-like protein